MKTRTANRWRRNLARQFTRRSEDQRRDIFVQPMQVRADSVNEEARTIDAVLSTGGRVRVIDWEDSYRQNRIVVIEEVLIARGMEVRSGDQVVMLDTHFRFSTESIRGSARSIRVAAESVEGTLHFARDDASDNAWQKARDGHLRAVSVGYTPLAWVDIKPGKSRVVGGREYKADKMRLRVTTRWRMNEVSLVPIGADPQALMRGDDRSNLTTEPKGMNDVLRKYLEKIGLRGDADEKEAWRFFDGLTGDNRRSAVLMHNLEPLGRNAIDGTVDPPADPPQQRSDPPPAGGTGGAGGGANPPQDADVERQRVSTIMDRAGGDVPRELVNQAIREGWTAERASAAFLDHVRQRLAAPQGGNSGVPDGAPAGHSRSRERDVTTRSLAARFATITNQNPIGMQLRGREVVREDSGAPIVLDERDADLGDLTGVTSAVDFCRECLRIDGARVPHDRDDMVRAAFSTVSFTNVFTTNVYASLMRAYEETDDTTDWCDVEDVPNFHTITDVRVGKMAQPKEHPRGGTAQLGTLSDEAETYAALRYSQQINFDEMDVIDDRLGAIVARTPREMGAAFKSIPQDLVYTILLSNPTLGADSIALFHASHANTASAAMDRSAIQAGVIAMSKQRQANRTLANRAQYLIMPTDLMFTADQLLNSPAIFIAGNTDTEQGSRNTLQNLGLQPRAEPRLTTAGVYNPATESMVAGSATNWFLASSPMAYPHIRKLYRAGTGRRPQMRTFILDKGQWGIGWDMVLDCGAAAVAFQGIYRGNS